MLADFDVTLSHPFQARRGGGRRRQATQTQRRNSGGRRGGTRLASSPPQQQIQRSPQIRKTQRPQMAVQSSQAKFREVVKEEQCQCNEVVTSEGGRYMCACQVLKRLLIDIPRCTTTRVLDGKKQGFCYTQPGACSLEHTDSQGR